MTRWGDHDTSSEEEHHEHRHDDPPEDAKDVTAVTTKQVSYNWERWFLFCILYV